MDLPLHSLDELLCLQLTQAELGSLQLEQAQDSLSEEELWYVLWEVAQGLAFLHLNRVLHLVSQCAVPCHASDERPFLAFKQNAAPR